MSRYRNMASKIDAMATWNTLNESYEDNTADLCCICGEPIEGYSNNPYPLVKDDDAKCCDACNIEVVKARLENFNRYRADEELKNASETKNRAKKYTRESHIQDAVDHFKKISGFSDDEVLTEDMLKKPFIESTCSRKSVTPDELKKALLSR